MSRPATLRTAIATLAVVLATVLGLATAWVAPTPARADDQPAVTITLASVTPASGATNAPITIRGTVENTSSVPMTWVQASFWRSRDPISTTDDLTNLLQAPATVPTGERWFHEANEASIDNITDTDGRTTFQPGQKATFQVTGTPTAMGLTTAGQAYVIGVHVQATPRGRDRLTVGRSRVLTVLTSSSGTSTKASITPVIVLASTPSMRVDGVFSDDHLATELTGRLGALVTEASTGGETVLVDPSLLDEVTAMAAGYRVASGTGTTAGTGQRAAKDWLAQVGPLLDSGNAYRLPYGGADVVEIALAGNRRTLTRVASALTSSNPAHDLPLAVLDDHGELTTAGLALLTSTLRPEIVLTSALGAAQGVRTSGTTTLVPLSSNVLSGGPSPTPSTTPAQVRGRVLAQSLLATRAGEQTVVTVSSTADLTATAGTSWLHHTTLAQATTSSTEGVTLPSTATATRLSTGWQADVGNAVHLTSDWLALLSTSTTASGTLDQVVARSLSQQISPRRRTAWLATAITPATTALGGSGVTLHSAPSFVMSSSSNEFPLAVTNNLSQSIRVKVTFTSENPQRVDIPDTAVVTVGPRETQTLKFTPHASSNGRVEMTATLTTASGRTLGSPAQFVVQATQMDDFGWIIIMVSGAVVVGATVLRIRQVRRRQG